MVVVLRFPHLVLANVGHNDRIAVRLTPEVVDHVGGVQMAVVGQVLNIPHGGSLIWNRQFARSNPYGQRCFRRGSSCCST